LSELSKVLGRYTHAAVASFGLPASIPPDAVSAVGGATRASRPPSVSASKPASIRRTTMMSAPAVGIDGAPSGIGATLSRARGWGARFGLALGVVGLAAMGLLLTVLRLFHAAEPAAAGSAAPHAAASAAAGLPEPPPAASVEARSAPAEAASVP